MSNATVTSKQQQQEQKKMKSNTTNPFREMNRFVHCNVKYVSFGGMKLFFSSISNNLDDSRSAVCRHWL